MEKRKGRPNRGRTETLKQRTVYLYAPTEKMLAKWKTEAERYGMSLSGFLVEVIDDAMRRNPAGLTPRDKVEKELSQATSDLQAVRMQRDSMRSRLEGSEATIARYRESLEDVLSYVPDEKVQKKVVSLFLKRGTWQIDDFTGEAGVDAGKPEELSKIQRTIEHLKRIGLVEGDFGTWRWLGGVKRKPRVPAEVRRRRRLRKLGKGLPKRLRPSGDDSTVGSIIRIEPE
jgi:hypothetical protein